MALPPLADRFTHSPLFREYPWLSDAFISGSWVEAGIGYGLKDYTTFLDDLDQRVPPANSTAHADAESRALLGLENTYNLVRDQVAANSKAVSKTWTTLLRFQVLDVLLATRWGTSDVPCAVGPAPTGLKQTELLASLSTWPDRFSEFQTSYQNEVRKIEKEAKRKARTSKGKAGAQNDALDGMSAPSPSVEFEAWSLVQKLSGMTTRSLFQKTTKNLQSIGTALTWIIESRASTDDLCPLTIRVNDLYNVTPSVATQVGTLAIIDLLRPLSYALNSSFLAVFCDLDLQKEFGNVMHQYETKMFLGRYKPPRLAYMEELVFAAVRDIAIGTSVDVSIAKFFSPDSEYLQNLPPSDPADLSIFVPADNIRLPAPSIRKRAKPVPLQLDVPQLPCSRVIATALASTIRHSPESSSVSQPDWSSLLALEEETDREEAEGIGATDGAALEKQVVPSGAEHGLDSTDLATTRADTKGASSKLLASADQDSSLSALAHSPKPPDSSVVQSVELTDLNGTNVEGSSAEVGLKDSSMPAPDSTSVDAKAEGSRKRLRSDSTVDTDKRPPEESPSKSAHKRPRQGDNAKPMFDTKSQAGGPGNKAEKQAKTKRKKKPSRSRQLASNKRNTVSVRVVEPLSEVEINPPKISDHRVSMSGFRPDGSKREFEFPLHVNSEHAEKPMIEGLQRAIDRQHVLYGNRAFVRHEPGRLPTEKPRKNEPTLYVLNQTEWNALTRLERTSLYKTGRNIFIIGMNVGELREGVEESLALLHRLDEDIEVQVPGLRLPPRKGDKKKADYSDINRLTTLRRFLSHAKRDDGLVLNALELPSSHYPHQNPLAGSGLDLEEVAYRQTAGLSTFGAQTPPNEKKWFDIAGTKWTTTLPHLDSAGGTIVGAQGPGEKFWITQRDDLDSIHDALTYRSWDPDCPDFETGQYEGVILPARGGTFLMQNVQHIVLGLPPDPKAAISGSLSATWITGGHYFVATRVRPALSVHLHLVMLEHVLTNVKHDDQWQILVRICAFWLDLTSVCPAEDLKLFAPYLPSLNGHSAEGWMDIVCLACVVVLSTPLDRRGYWKAIPPYEILQREHVVSMYQRWRRWFASKYVGRSGDVTIEWEKDVFTPMLLHLAQVLIQYHEEEEAESENDVSTALVEFGSEMVRDKVVKALERYSAGLGAKLDDTPQHSRFWLYSGEEFSVQALPHLS